MFCDIWRQARGRYIQLIKCNIIINHDARGL